MLTIEELNTFANTADLLKEYFDKCYDNLNELNKRSNRITISILILIVIHYFSPAIKEISIVDIKVDLSLVNYSIPLLIPYFTFEWVLIAKRRRELMKIIKFSGYKLFKIPKGSDEVNGNEYSLLTRNTMPFSMMIEILNINIKSGLLQIMYLGILFATFLIMPYLLIKPLVQSYRIGNLPSPVLCANIIGIVCLLLIAIFYIWEIKDVIRVTRDDRLYLKNRP
jgi:hypothetical protein